MSTPWTRRLGALAVVALLASGCGGKAEEPQADPTPSATPSQTPTPSPSASATPTATPQPRSTTGVTFFIRNWAEYADDPAVLAFKKANEAGNGSLTQGKTLPDLRRWTTDKIFRLYLQQLAAAKAQGWKVPKRSLVEVRSSKRKGSTATVTVCLWKPSASVYFKDGSSVAGGTVEKAWRREVVQVTKGGGSWRLADVKDPGNCQGLPQP